MSTSRDSYSVFLVDDDKMFLSSLKNTLNQQFKSGVVVSTFTNGEECLKKIEASPDIVVLDYYLNDDQHPNAMDGMEVLKKIKETSQDSMVIMLSGQDKLQVALDSIKNGAYEYVAKSESAFVRIQNVIKNSLANIKDARENKTYQKWNIIMAVTIFVVLLIDVIYYYAGHY
jgi:two-component system OmpR family response regulator